MTKFEELKRGLESQGKSKEAAKFWAGVWLWYNGTEREKLDVPKRTRANIARDYIARVPLNDRPSRRYFKEFEQ